jgi:iron-sulfur cluster assembly protein
MTITERAKTKILEIKDKEYVRVGVQGGGCSGLKYNLEFTDNKTDSDQIFEFDSVILICDLKSYLYIANSELDHTDGLNGKGFHFNNPNATRTCGCGESFSI